MQWEEEAELMATGKRWLCMRCGTLAEAGYYRAGSLIVTLLLLLLGIIPGIVYIVWARSASYWGCRKCGSRQIIPSDSPRAVQSLGAVSEILPDA